MTVEGVDYSFGRPGGAALAAAGKKFAVRYCPYPGDGGKGLTAAELADLQAHGIAVALVFESTAGRARGGHDAGVADGQLALKAKTALHFDADRPVYFAVDFNTTPNDYPTIDAYLRGAALAVGAANVGVYGEASLLDKMKALGSARWFWQTYAWSGGAVSDAAHLLQYLNGQRINGAAVDLCRAFTADYGQTPKPGSTTAGGNEPDSGWRLTVEDGATVRHSTVGSDHRYRLPDDATPWHADTIPCHPRAQVLTTSGRSITAVFVPGGHFGGRWVHLGPKVTAKKVTP